MLTGVTAVLLAIPQISVERLHSLLQLSSLSSVHLPSFHLFQALSIPKDLFAMTETQLPTASMSLPPPQYSGAPGQQPYDTNTSNGGSSTHMPPPPLPPVVIPQNTNPIPTAMTSPGGGDGETNPILSPSSGSAGSFVRRAAPEPNKRALYVGGLDPRVTEDVLRQIFETTGHVQNVKIIPDKNMGAVSRNIPLRVCASTALL